MTNNALDHSGAYREESLAIDSDLALVEERGGGGVRAGWSEPDLIGGNTVLRQLVHPHDAQICATSLCVIGL
jgi:hypothetical protein